MTYVKVKHMITAQKTRKRNEKHSITGSYTTSKAKYYLKLDCDKLNFML